MAESKVLFVFGTRPEAIKLCPLIRHMRIHGVFNTRVCVTAQHREMLDQVLQLFSVQPDHDIGVMIPGQTLFQSTARIMAGLETVLVTERPSLVVVQGDTTTTFCGALASFYAGIPLGHVEAGLRTGSFREPFPEEMNRVLTTRLATLHFAATERAQQNLLDEGVPAESVAVTGNTGVDAVLETAAALDNGVVAPVRPWNDLDPARKLIVVTAHRRETFGAGFERICTALQKLACRPDVQIVYPVHPNPNVNDPVRKHLAGKSNILLTAPLDYVSFVDLMRRACLLLTDSGGVQEEAPSLGKPVLVMRNTTERPEAVEAGTAELVGDDPEQITGRTAWLLDNEHEYALRSRLYNPYGDGRASERITQIVAGFLREQCRETDLRRL